MKETKKKEKEKNLLLNDSESIQQKKKGKMLGT